MFFQVFFGAPQNKARKIGNIATQRIMNWMGFNKQSRRNLQLCGWMICLKRLLKLYVPIAFNQQLNSWNWNRQSQDPASRTNFLGGYPMRFERTYWCVIQWKAKKPPKLTSLFSVGALSVGHTSEVTNKKLRKLLPNNSISPIQEISKNYTWLRAMCELFPEKVAMHLYPQSMEQTWSFGFRGGLF